MRGSIGKVLLAVFMTVLIAGSGHAREVNPNGFPSGSHYNLNIIGKKAGFACPDQEFDPMTGAPIYGNVVFVPENGEGIQLLMQSGSTKGKNVSTITELRAIDPCATFDGDPAIMQLPPNGAGYRVYARALAKPTYNPDMSITPSLVAVLDEFGNDLVYLGLVTDNGFVRSDGVTVTRSKGKSTAVNVTGLFEWSGQVCYFTPPEGEYTESPICCIDSDGSGTFDACTAPVVPTDPALPVYCADPAYTLVSTYCKSYQEEWVFNVADFVEYLWSLDNNGSKLVQVRFYPN